MRQFGKATNPEANPGSVIHHDDGYGLQLPLDSTGRRIEEDMWNGRPDWRKEISMIEAALAKHAGSAGGCK